MINQEVLTEAYKLIKEIQKNKLFSLHVEIHKHYPDDFSKPAQEYFHLYVDKISKAYSPSASGGNLKRRTYVAFEGSGPKLLAWLRGAKHALKYFSMVG